METRVERTVFERTDFGSFGWLKEGQATPAYETAFFAAIEAFSKQSVRTRKRRDLPFRTDFGSFAWIFTNLPSVFDVTLFPGIESLAKSFLSKGSLKLDTRLADFDSFGWIKEGRLTPSYETAFFAATNAQVNSFRMAQGKRLDSAYHLNQPVFAMWFQGGSGITVLIDGSGTVTLASQYDNLMVGSDEENNKWDILSFYP